MIRPNFPWHAEVPEPGDSRNAIDGLDHALRKFFTYLKAGKKPGFPRSKKKDVKGGFELREKPKFKGDGAKLRIEKLKDLIPAPEIALWRYPEASHF